MHGEMIKSIDKGNMHAVFPSCNTIETWDHVVLYDKMKHKQDECVNELDKSLNDLIIKVKALTYERKIVNGMMKDVRKHFNKENI